MPEAFPLAVILSGGLSRRMGRDKAGVSLDGRPLLAHVIDRLAPQTSAISLNAPDRPTGFGSLELVPDTMPGRPGPLAGILSAMRHAQDRGEDRVLTVSIDAPFLPEDLSVRLAQSANQRAAIVVAASSGRMHPVVGLWPTTLADNLEAWLAAPEHRRVTDYLALHPVRTVQFSLHERQGHAVDPFFNINTEDDLQLAETLLRETGQ